MNRLKIILLINILTIVVTPLYSQNCFEPIIQQLYSYEDPVIIYQSLETIFMECEFVESELDMLLFESDYYYYLALINLRQNDKRLAKNNLQLAYDISLYALELNDSINVYRRLALIGFELSAVKGVGAIISMGDELDFYTDKVLEYSPEDAQGIVMKSQRLTFAPKFAGGNPEEALNIIQTNLLNIDSLPDYLIFDTYFVISNAYEKTDNYIRAFEFAEKALSLFPENEEAIERVYLLQ